MQILYDLYLGVTYTWETVHFDILLLVESGFKMPIIKVLIQYTYKTTNINNNEKIKGKKFLLHNKHNIIT